MQAGEGRKTNPQKEAKVWLRNGGSFTGNSKIKLKSSWSFLAQDGVSKSYSLGQPEGWAFSGRARHTVF